MATQGKLGVFSVLRCGLAGLQRSQNSRKVQQRDRETTVNGQNVTVGTIATLHSARYVVLVKCRQNVANKLFITRVFNPVHPRTATN